MKVLFGNGFFWWDFVLQSLSVMYLVVNICCLVEFGCEVPNLVPPFQTSSRLSNICKLVGFDMTTYYCFAWSKQQKQVIGQILTQNGEQQQYDEGQHNQSEHHFTTPSLIPSHHPGDGVFSFLHRWKWVSLISSFSQLLSFLVFLLLLLLICLCSILFSWFSFPPFFSCFFEK